MSQHVEFFHSLIFCLLSTHLLPVATPLDMASVQTVKGSTISFHNLKYTVQVKPPGKCCAKSEGKEIINGVRLVKSMVLESNRVYNVAGKIGAFCGAWLCKYFHLDSCRFVSWVVIFFVAIM